MHTELPDPLDTPSPAGRAFLQIQQEFDGFSRYLWGFVDDEPIDNRFRRKDQIPAQTPLSDAISKDLKQRGMNFVGSTIVYAYMQSIGLVNDHLTNCGVRLV